MVGEPVTTVIGNLTDSPELRFTPSGAAVANFTVASTPRTFDRQANEWKDGETLWMRCSAWRDLAENAAASLHKGDRVIASGRLVSRSWQTQEGENRTVMEMQVEEVGPSLRNATATVVKAQRQGGQQGGQQQAQQGGQGNAWGPPQGGQQGQQQGDPWATPQGGQQQAQPPQQGGQQGGTPSYDQPPF